MRRFAAAAIILATLAVGVPSAEANTKPPASCLKALKSARTMRELDSGITKNVADFFTRMKTFATQNPNPSAFFNAYAQYANDLNDQVVGTIPDIQLVVSDLDRYSRQCRAGK